MPVNNNRESSFAWQGTTLKASPTSVTHEFHSTTSRTGHGGPAQLRYDESPNVVHVHPAR